MFDEDRRVLSKLSPEMAYLAFMHFTTAHNNCFALLLIQLQVDMQQDHLFLLLFACRDALANSVEKMLHRKIIPVLEM